MGVKTGVIIQARLAATRFPNKVVLPMPNGKTVVEHIVSRAAAIKNLDEIIVAIPEEDGESVLYQCAARSGAKVFLGSAEDVLSRYYHCAKEYSLDVILRITSDDPFRDPDVEGAVLQALLQDESIDYVKTTGLPEGVNTEGFRFSALERAYREAKLVSEREHATPYIWKNPVLFHCRQIDYPDAWQHYRLTLDMDVDWKVITAIDAALYRQAPLYRLDAIAAFLQRNPQLLTLNSHIEYQAGYKKSLAEDRKIEE